MSDSLDVVLLAKRRRTKIVCAIMYWQMMVSVIIALNVVERPFIPDIRLDLHQLPDLAVNMFRFDVYEILHMCNAIALPLVLWTKNRVRVLGYEALCVLLHHLAFPVRGSTAISVFGRSRSALSQITHMMLHWLDDTWGHLLLLDPDHWRHRMAGWANACRGKLGQGLRNVVAFIDCKLVGTCKPTPARRKFPAGSYNALQQSIYSGHKRKHGLKFESVTGMNGILWGLSGPWEGRHHDSWILRQSGTLATLLKLIDGMGQIFCVYGDSGYPLSLHLQVPWPLVVPGSPHARFNRIMSRLRITVEWGFGIISNLWSGTDFKRWMRCFLTLPGLKYRVAGLLTNFHCCIRGGNQISKYFDVAPPSLEEYLTQTY
jgi:hypothetical protein